MSVENLMELSKGLIKAIEDISSTEINEDGFKGRIYSGEIEANYVVTVDGIDYHFRISRKLDIKI